MSDPIRPMIPGGPTERIALNGGEALHERLELLLAGERIDAVLYALTRSLVGFALQSMSDLPKAEKLVDDVAADVKNELRINWPERAGLLAEGRLALRMMRKGVQ